jgi:sensor histidine kinase regulating citrate/malate metabolism
MMKNLNFQEVAVKEKITTSGRLLSDVFSSYKSAFEALCELINNSIQAKAKKIELFINYTLDADFRPLAIEAIKIKDDGCGVSKTEFSDKILKIATDTKIGGKGVGRFAAFQIGARQCGLEGRGTNT